MRGLQPSGVLTMWERPATPEEAAGLAGLCGRLTDAFAELLAVGDAPDRNGRPLDVGPWHEAAAALLVLADPTAESRYRCRVCGVGEHERHEAEWHALTRHPAAVRAVLTAAGAVSEAARGGGGPMAYVIVAAAAAAGLWFIYSEPVGPP